MTLTLQPDVILKWIATGLIIVGAILTSGNWFYPWNVVLLLLGNLAWTVVSIMWRDLSLIVLNTGITTIYGAGLIFKYWT